MESSPSPVHRLADEPVREVGEGSTGAGRKRTRCLPLADRVLLVAVYYRTNLTMRQLAPLFGISAAIVCRVIQCLRPLLAIEPAPRPVADVERLWRWTDPRPGLRVRRRVLPQLSVLGECTGHRRCGQPPGDCLSPSLRPHEEPENPPRPPPERETPPPRRPSRRHHAQPRHDTLNHQVKHHIDLLTPTLLQHALRARARLAVGRRRVRWSLGAHVCQAGIRSAVCCWDSRPAMAWTVSSMCSRRPR